MPDQAIFLETGKNDSVFQESGVAETGKAIFF